MPDSTNKTCIPDNSFAYISNGSRLGPFRSDFNEKKMFASKKTSESPLNLGIKSNEYVLHANGTVSYIHFICFIVKLKQKQSLNYNLSFHDLVIII